KYCYNDDDCKSECMVVKYCQQGTCYCKGN
uniref:Orphan peptide CllNtx n=1 Tax=Centruroides limpidus TaxID=6876 RepID=UNTX_CENLI|nr:RecName: Full=Orphan peptide CllNtx [Centruroides limpidus]